MKSIHKETFVKIAPLIGLIFLGLIFLVLGTIKGINISYGLQAIINQSVIVAIVATGAIFIYTLGSFDISLGASTAVSALVGGMAYLKTESLLVMFLVCVGVAILVAIINSFMAALFNLPVFVTTVAMLSVLNAIVLLLIGMNGTGSEISVPSVAVTHLDTLFVKIIVLGLFFLFCVFIYNYTKIGRQQKLIGGNPICAKLTGISEKKLSIIAFIITGLGIGIASFLTIVYAPTLTQHTAGSIGMDVIIAIVFGGMPVSGGPASKISAAIIGAFSMTLLSQIMLMMNFNTGIGQMVKAIIFLGVVCLAMSNYKQQKVLVR